jgi:serine/threonine protein phosphatase PrpC
MRVASKVIPYYDEEGYDKIVVRESDGMFGVFDGIGVSDSSRWASQTCAEQFDKLSAADYRGLVVYLGDMIKLFSSRPDAGTTATVVLVDKDGVLHYAHCGDSRLYITNDERLRQVTIDEGEGNFLSNYVGLNCKVVQSGTMESWDKFLLCSDGITGDWPKQRIPDKTIEHILNDSTEEALGCLINASSKHDDKSIIIVSK